MAKLLDYDDYFFLKKESVVDKINLSFYPHEDSIIRLAVNDSASKMIDFNIIPMINALSFNPRLFLKDSDIFELKINPRLLPANWSGDLFINDSGVVSKIELNFSKKELN
jgi:hypothetical protein